ncbi:MAG: NADPH-dependent FMN reductase, partial [Alphaproteobacteria bacterium]
MTNIAVVYHSGYGHTRAVAEAVAEGVQAVSGAKVRLIQVGEAEAHEPELDAADAIIFGSPTY